MKKQKKIEIVSVACGLAFIGLVFTLGLSLFKDPAMAGVFAISAAVAILLGVAIED